MTITKWNLFSISILQDCIKDKRDEPKTRMDATSGADVDIIHRAKKHEVKCDKTKRELISSMFKSNECQSTNSTKETIVK